MKNNPIVMFFAIFALIGPAACTGVEETKEVASDSVLYDIMRENDFANLIVLRDRFYSSGPSEAEINWLKANVKNPRHLGLYNYGNLLIPHRVTAGDMAFNANGVLCAHDLYTVGGRAEWLLRVIDTENSQAQWRVGVASNNPMEGW